MCFTVTTWGERGPRGNLPALLYLPVGGTINDLPFLSRVNIPVNSVVLEGTIN